jgi:glutathione S-transferase
MWLALEAGTHKEFRPLFYLCVIRPRLLAAGLTPDTVGDHLPDGVHASHARWLRDVLAGDPRFDTSEQLARAIILSKLDFLERGLAGRDYLVAGSLTMADVAWFTRIDGLPALGIPLSRERLPAIVGWYERLATRPAFVASAG